MSALLDDVSRVIASPISRRRAFKIVSGAVGGAILASLGLGRSARGQQTQANCTDGQTRCGNTCCHPYEMCCGGTCYGAGAYADYVCCGGATLCNKESEQCCGTACCSRRHTCCGNQCCSRGQTCCGSQCCNSNVECCGYGTKCCTPSSPKCCGYTCYPANYQCCGTKACPPGQWCCNGKCYAERPSPSRGCERV